MGDRGKERPRTDDVAAQHRSGSAGQCDRYEASGLPLEEQQLNSQQRGGIGAAKVADIPAAAPATSSVLRSALVR